MNTTALPPVVLQAFGISANAVVNPLGSGHIHQTFLVDANEKLVVQRINKNVFTKPEAIAGNNRLAAHYLAAHHPAYLFLTALCDGAGNELIYAEDGFPWRAYPLIENTFTVDFVTSSEQAHEAAKGFGLFTRNLHGIDSSGFVPTLDRFHDLHWRYEQFEHALAQAPPALTKQAAAEISRAKEFQFLVNQYNELVRGNSMMIRITHNDTKINNILFDKNTGKAACVIDLDTLMPGYFIYDLGDMVRTCVSPVSEEEADLGRIDFRKEIYEAITEGYLLQMKEFMSATELQAVPFAGKMMTYIMALRFLADYLRGNTYYTIHYPEQNLVRARNQLQLLTLMQKYL
ncbi:MAG: aminoglycoside phosphotransferase family protein [Cyclobacteriaceae bacterium]|nr:aminoglycoside phosphotransferase family protein [Cytophagales bacterium]MBX2901125.1 aminoglycoside phosphotransferase family protein [Cyclobacteriaceae bacterium]